MDFGFVSASVTGRVKRPFQDVPCHPFHTHGMTPLQCSPIVAEGKWRDAGEVPMELARLLFVT